MTKFCRVCKAHVSLREDAEDPLKDFFDAGHSADTVSRLQRDPGRKQRKYEWQRGES